MWLCQDTALESTSSCNHGRTWEDSETLEVWPDFVPKGVNEFRPPRGAPTASGKRETYTVRDPLHPASVVTQELGKNIWWEKGSILDHFKCRPRLNSTSFRTFQGRCIFVLRAYLRGDLDAGIITPWLVWSSILCWGSEDETMKVKVVDIEWNDYAYPVVWQIRVSQLEDLLKS